MRSKKIVVGNWKMSPATLKESEKLASSVSKNISKIKNTEVVLCPPFVSIAFVSKITKKAKLGAQDSFWQDEGSFTGEISPKMLSNIGARYVILGHSERRALGETDENINKKIKASLGQDLKIILCVGEEARDENHQYLQVVQSQLEASLHSITKGSFENIIIAYEPVWAIGKKAVRSATAEEFLEMSIFIRKVLSDRFGSKNIENIKILYGGSVHPENAKEFLEAGKADGFLVGRDSLDAKKFLQIIEITENANN